MPTCLMNVLAAHARCNTRIVLCRQISRLLHTRRARGNRERGGRYRSFSVRQRFCQALVPGRALLELPLPAAAACCSLGLHGSSMR